MKYLDATYLNIFDKLYDNLIVNDRYMFLLRGLVITIEIAFFAIILGTVLGFIVAFMKLSNSRILRKIANIYTTIVRGTPVMVQLLIITYGIFAATNIPDVLIGIIAFGFNSGAYVSEIVRGGILSVDHGQTEAGRSLGFNGRDTMRYIVLPQAIKNIFPSLVNEFIVLLKETAIVGYISLADITKGADIIRSRTFDAWIPLLSAAAIYLVLVMGLTKLMNMIERRLRQSDTR